MVVVVVVGFDLYGDGWFPFLYAKSLSFPLSLAASLRACRCLFPFPPFNSVFIFLSSSSGWVGSVLAGC